MSPLFIYSSCSSKSAGNDKLPSQTHVSVALQLTVWINMLCKLTAFQNSDLCPDHQGKQELFGEITSINTQVWWLNWSLPKNQSIRNDKNAHKGLNSTWVNSNINVWKNRVTFFFYDFDYNGVLFETHGWSNIQQLCSSACPRGIICSARRKGRGKRKFHMLTFTQWAFFFFKLHSTF